ncbi:MAG: DUF4123 domain-containing protein [Betaproteobacteria bacterium]|jgi:hypothetical protein|nr:DUF4123 domain-containing protein [Rubrivivax sp.]
MTPELRQQILDVLWPPGQARHASVWAVLDCARDPAIYRLLLESRLEFLCLYSGKLPRELELVAPHIVELLPGHRLTERLLDEGWGRAWGVFVSIDDPTALRPHLRRLLKVQDETGRRLLFRFYDPRVLRAFVPTCRPDELQQLFGPIGACFAEDEDAARLLTFRIAQGGLSMREPAPDG